MIKLGYDFQGWPFYALNLREILFSLGFEAKDGKIYISADDEILDAYPRLLEDDGMGYGVDECYITEADRDLFDNDVDCVTEKQGSYKEINPKEGTEKATFPIIEEYIKTKEPVKVFNLFREVPTNDKYVKMLNKQLKKDWDEHYSKYFKRVEDENNDIG
jgi:hypothetical protein